MAHPVVNEIEIVNDVLTCSLSGFFKGYRGYGLLEDLFSMREEVTKYICVCENITGMGGRSLGVLLLNGDKLSDLGGFLYLVNLSEPMEKLFTAIGLNNNKIRIFGTHEEASLHIK